MLRHGVEHLSAAQRTRLDAALHAGDPTEEVAVAWSCCEQLRSAYNAANPNTGRSIAEKVLCRSPRCV